MYNSCGLPDLCKDWLQGVSSSVFWYQAKALFHGTLMQIDVAGFLAQDLDGWKEIRKEFEVLKCKEFGE